MRTHLFALAAIIAGVATVSLQAEQDISGTIRSIDSSNYRVTLDNGQVIQLHPNTNMGTLREGALIEDSRGSGMLDCTTVAPESLDDTPSLTQPPANPEMQSLPGAPGSNGHGGGADSGGNSN